MATIQNLMSMGLWWEDWMLLDLEQHSDSFHISCHSKVKKTLWLCGS